MDEKATFRLAFVSMPIVPLPLIRSGQTLHHTTQPTRALGTRRAHPPLAETARLVFKLEGMNLWDTSAYLRQIGLFSGNVLLTILRSSRKSSEMMR